ncbi:hypothetical protein WJX74_000546 [Apatococcus lobatus]|uniref:Kinesin motor domain-containing protein n=1 Tax=Apatococcus lobatus TaxID=904363 RepID=A0AAW1R078_9CHLO
MKKNRPQDQQKQAEQRKPSTRPLVPNNKTLPRGIASQHQGQEKGVRPSRQNSRVTESTANKENVPKPTPRVGTKPALPKPTGINSTRAPTTRAASRLHSQTSLKATPSNISSTQVRRPALVTGDKLLDNFDDLTIEFETLKRQSLRASISGSAIKQATPHTLLEPSAKAVLSRMAKAGPRPASTADRPAFSKSITDLAEELFDEPGFLDLCGKAMNTNLQRTRDGATAESRVQELAGLVKLLRKCYTQLMSKTQVLMQAGATAEREARQHADTTRLSSESSSKQLEAEVANAKSAAAQAAAAHKAASASWQSELALQRTEASHLQRDINRLQQDRDSARDQTHRLEEARCHAEASLQTLQKQCAEQGEELAQLRESQSQALQSHTDAADAKELGFQDRIRELEQKLADVQTTSHQAEAQLAGSNEVAEKLEDSLQELHLRVEHLTVNLNEVRLERDDFQGRCKAEVSNRQGLGTEVAQLQIALDEARAESSTAVAHLQATQAQLLSTQQQGKLCQQECHDLQVQLRQCQEQESTWATEKAQLKAGLGAALDQKGSIESDLSAMHSLIGTLQNQVREASETSREQQQEVQQLQEQVTAASKAKLATQEAAQEKLARLGQLEGELEALQDVVGAGGDQADMLKRLVSRVANLELAVGQGNNARRLLHNQLVEMRGNIRVFCRVRPSPSSVVTCQSDGSGVRVDGGEASIQGTFSFDKVFGPACSQQTVFDEVAELVQSALDGYQVCLFSYGQTGAGKTHTMQGLPSSQGQGIIPRSVAKILDTVKILQEPGWEYDLEASYIEVYNEALQDLLAEGKGRDVGKITVANAIKHGPSGEPTYVVGARRVKINDSETAAGLIKQAGAARASESTAMNATSSRSHSIFMLFITGRHAPTATLVQGALNLVDLAGSERLARSEVTGQRQKEACCINKSLSSLGDVFSALASKSAHVPYRNSKLTHLLQPCLGGTGKTLMFVNINPEPASAGETLCSLRFAAQVNACERGAKGGARRHVSQQPEQPKLQAEAASKDRKHGAAASKRKAGAPEVPPRNTRPRLHK